MKVKCIATTGESYMAYKMPIGYMSTSQYPLHLGEEYLVMGISLSQGVILYLIDIGARIYCPFQLFEVVDPSLNSGWQFKVYTIESKFYPYRQADWCYPEMQDDIFIDNLLERNEE